MKITLPIFITLGLFLLLGCKKNTSPKIIAISEPKSEYISSDSSIDFEFEANDKDGKIKNLVLYINDNFFCRYFNI